MAKIERFEDVVAWQHARSLVKKIYALPQRTKESFHDYSFRDQIRRAAVSAMSNIAEGFERFSDKEFTQFLIVAKGSVGEVRSQLYVALDLNYISQQEFIEVKTDCEMVSRYISNLIKYLKNSTKPSKS